MTPGLPLKSGSTDNSFPSQWRCVHSFEAGSYWSGFTGEFRRSSAIISSTESMDCPSKHFDANHLRAPTNRIGNFSFVGRASSLRVSEPQFIVLMGEESAVTLKSI